jgi:hypothetical protein
MGVGTLEGQLRAGAHHVADLRCVYFDEDEQEEQNLCRPPQTPPRPPARPASWPGRNRHGLD